MSRAYTHRQSDVWMFFLETSFGISLYTTTQTTPFARILRAYRYVSQSDTLTGGYALMTGETHRHGRVVVGMELEAGDAADELWCRPWCHGSSFRLGFLFLCFFSGWCRMIQFLFEILSLMLLQCHSLMVRATFFFIRGFGCWIGSSFHEQHILLSSSTYQVLLLWRMEQCSSTKTTRST